MADANLAVFLSRHGVETPDEYVDGLAMVAVHAWDVHGAKQAGLVTGWADRLEGRWNAAMAHPDVTGSSLVEVVEGPVG